MANRPITLSNWNNGGLSDSKWSGIPDSLYRMVGLDPHTEPAVLKADWKLTKHSGTTITEFCKWQVTSSNGCIYHFSSESGKIWQTDSSGTVTLVYTTSASAGESLCLGAIEHQGYIVWATSARLHRILASNAVGAAAWAANAVANWQTLSVGDTSWHPMVEQNLDLYIGDGHYLAVWDGSTFTADALDIKTPMRIKCLGKIGTDVLLGTYVDANVTKTEIYRWNTWSVSFTTSDQIDEVGINAFIPADNFVFVSAGIEGNIYSYDGEKLELYKKIPGSYSTSATAIVHPDATANLLGQVLFGVSNVTGNPCLQGVYRMGRHSRNYPWIMDLAYPISQRSGSDLVLTEVEIGSIVTAGQKIYVSWKNGSTVGVDVLDYTARLSGAYFETRVMRPDRLKFSVFNEFVMAYNSLPTDTALTLYFDKNYTGSYTTPTSSQVIDTDRKLISLKEGIEATALQLKVVYTCTGVYTPSLEELDIFLN